MIVLVAHDSKKQTLVEWATSSIGKLSGFWLAGTKHTVKALKAEDLSESLSFRRTYKSGPFGGDAQIASDIVKGKVTALIFFYDPVGTHPHIDDVRMVLRLATLYNVPTACNKATADLLINSL